MRATGRAGVVVVAAASLCLTVAGCGRSHPGAAVDPTAPPSSLGPQVTIRVGFLGVTGGHGSALSRAVSDGERLAVSQFSDNDEGVDVIIDRVSTSGTAAGAAAAARRLVADGVVAVIGPQASPEVRGAAPVLTAAGIPAITASATATNLATDGWTSFFRVVADDRQQGIATAREIVTSMHATDVAVLDGPDATDTARSAATAHEVTLLGAHVGLRRTVHTSTQARTVATEIVGAGLDSVYLACSEATARALVAALVADGYQGAMLVASDLPTSVLQPLGATADGVYLLSAADDPAVAAADGGGALVFDDAYRAAFGSQPPTWAAEAYDATNAFLGGVAAGSRTGAELGAYLLGHTSAGVTGTVAFGPTGNQVDPPLYVSQIRSGTPVQIAVTPQAGH